MDSSHGWIAIVILVFTAVATLMLVREFGMRDVHTFHQIAKCAVQEDPTLRETTGTATYNVTFQDGDWVEITCANEVAE